MTTTTTTTTTTTQTTTTATTATATDLTVNDPTANFVLVDTGAIKPVQKKQSYCDEIFHKCLTRADDDDDDDDNSSNNSNITMRRLNEPINEKAFILSNVLLKEECEQLILGIERLNEYTFWNAEEEEEKEEKMRRRRTEFRNSLTVEVTSESIALEIWGRVKEFVQKDIEIKEGDALHESGLDGIWECYGINEHLLFNKYAEGCHFSPHTDGATVKDFNRRSFYSVLIYLNDCKYGGETSLFTEPETASLQYFAIDENERYRWPKEWICDQAKCESGTCLIFRQDLAHEGVPVGENCEKIIIRTDVMYERVEKKCADENGKRAYELHKRAQNEESDGNLTSAISLLKQCRRVCPEYADLVRI